MKRKLFALILAVVTTLGSVLFMVTAQDTQQIDPKYAGSYIDGDNFAAFIDMTDSTFVKIDGTEDWVVTDKTGALDGKAVASLRKANPNNVTADGITVTFSVPATGEYSIWARALYPTQTANSLFYSVDGGEQYIWDFPDEDAASAACYGSWQYFYMTERAAGTYTDTNLYGAWTIQNNQWRHQPHTVQLTAGEHTIKITAREGGVFLDELVITSYGYNDYNPNAFTIEGENNTSFLESCKFCGPANKHYVKDIYALKGVTAESYFASTVCPTATPWNGELKAEATTEAPTTEPTTTEEPTTEPTTTEAPTEEATTAPKKDETTAPKDDGTTAPDTETKAPDNTTEEKGCGAGIATGTVAFIALAAIAGSALTKKKKK